MIVLPQFIDFLPFICWYLYVRAKPLQSCPAFCQPPVFFSHSYHRPEKKVSLSKVFKQRDSMKLGNESKITWLTNVGARSENYFLCFSPEP